MKNFEVIVVDDGSIDNTQQVLAELQNKYNNLKVFTTEHKRTAHARHLAYKNATGKYIVQIDADDKIRQGYFKFIKELIDKYLELDMVLFNYDSYLSKQDKWENSNYNFEEGFYDKRQLNSKLYPKIFNKLRFTSGIILATCNIVYRKDYLMAHLCPDERIYYGEDSAYAYDCLYCANRVYVSKNAFYIYIREDKGSVTYKHKFPIKQISMLHKYMAQNNCKGMKKWRIKLWFAFFALYVDFVKNYIYKSSVSSKSSKK